MGARTRCANMIEQSLQFTLCSFKGAVWYSSLLVGIGAESWTTLHFRVWQGMGPCGARDGAQGPNYVSHCVTLELALYHYLVYHLDNSG